MAKRSGGIFGMLAEAPWWMSVMFAALVFVALRFVLPGMLEALFLPGLGRACSSSAPWISLLFLVPGAMSVVRSLKKRRLLRGRTDISTIRSLPFHGFEELVHEAYRRQGYSLTERSGHEEIDAGADIVARRDNETILVRCRQWRTRKVGVDTVREVFGLLKAEGATEGHIVTGGSFTDEAKQFAADKPIRLIDGLRLIELIKLARSPLSKDEAKVKRIKAEG